MSGILQKRFIDKFDGVVIINDDHPLALAQDDIDAKKKGVKIVTTSLEPKKDAVAALAGSRVVTVTEVPVVEESDEDEDVEEAPVRVKKTKKLRR
jgi:hypothetical protein